MSSASRFMRPLSPAGSQFGPTMLPRVEQACAGDTQALEELAGRYWYPAYAYLRKWGNDRERSEDLVQEFSAGFFTPESLTKFEPDKGRFRSFLLLRLRHFARDRWQAEHARKRGSGAEHASLDATDDEGRRLHEVPDDSDAVRAFERKWAQAVLMLAREALRADWTSRGRAALFNALEFLLDGERSDDGYALLGRRLGMSEAMVKKTAAQLREAFETHQLAVLRHELAGLRDKPTDRQLLDELKSALRNQS